MKRLLVLMILTGLELPAAASDSVAKATFSTRCFWRGEAAVGTVVGVRETRIGDIDGIDIVEVTYDPTVASLKEFVAALKASGTFGSVVVTRDEDAPAAVSAVGWDEIVRTAREPRFIDSKHTLRTRHPAIWQLGLNEHQAIALNSWAFFGGPMPDVLTEEQKEGLRSLSRVAR